MITAEDVPGDNNHNGEVVFAKNEVCDLCMADYSNILLKMPKRLLVMSITSMDSFSHHKDLQRTNDSSSVMLKFSLELCNFLRF